jgi:hypothetical protein
MHSGSLGEMIMRDSPFLDELCAQTAKFAPQRTVDPLKSGHSNSAQIKTHQYLIKQNIQIGSRQIRSFDSVASL